MKSIIRITAPNIIAITATIMAVIGMCTSDCRTGRETLALNAKKLIQTGIKPSELGKYNNPDLYNSKVCVICGTQYKTIGAAVDCCTD